MFPHQKNDDNLEAVFSCFWHPQEVPDLPKSSQNAVRVCKNEGHTFSRKTAFSYKREPKMTSLGTPKESQKLEKCRKRHSPNQLQKNMEKTPQIQKKIAQRYPKVTRTLPPPPPPYPGRATPAHPQSRVSAKALESLLKLFAMVCSTHFVLARRIGGFMYGLNMFGFTTRLIMRM